jgi:Trk K+ transport system NAD-binding subunit
MGAWLIADSHMRFDTELGRWGRPSTWRSWWRDADLWQRRAIKSVFAIVGFIAVMSVTYHYLMVVYEGRSPSFSHSLQVVIETTTGTGYGSDSAWETTIANLFVSAMDLSTFLLLFIVFPYVFQPVLEDALSPTAPTAVDKQDHVVVCGVYHQGDQLIDEFRARDTDYVVVVEPEEQALEFVDADVSVIHGDPTSTETLRNACVDAAASVVVDTTDRQAASVVLAVRELRETISTVVLVESLENERNLLYAGADQVLTPRQLLGRRIAERITTEISPTRSDSISLREEFSVLELTVFEGSPIHGESVASIERRGDITVIGLWKEGTFVESPAPDTVVDEQTVLLVGGEDTDLADLETEAYRSREMEPRVVVAGHGIVGSTVHQELQQSVIDCTVVDIRDEDHVDVVGDVTEEETLLAADIDRASTYVLTIADDDEAILSTLLADELTTGLDIIVRINHSENETKVRRAGADYVLGLQEISGRILAEAVLREEILSTTRQLKIVRIDGSPFAGETVGESEIGATDCLVVSVERNGEFVTDVPGTFEIQDADQLVVAGSDEELSSLRS